MAYVSCLSHVCLDLMFPASSPPLLTALLDGIAHSATRPIQLHSGTQTDEPYRDEHVCMNAWEGSHGAERGDACVSCTC